MQQSSSAEEPTKKRYIGADELISEDEQDSKIYTDGINNKLTIIQYHFVDPTFTPVEELKLKDMLNFMSNKKTRQ